MPGIVERTQTNKREDISDLMIQARINETPFLAMVSKGDEARNTLFEWPIDQPIAPRTTGVPDDQDATAFQNMSPDRTKLKGRLQIFERLPKVSRLADKVSDVAGVGNRREFAKQVVKAISACALDIETRCMSTDDSADESVAGAYETRGAAEWIKATAQTDLPVPAAYRTPAASIYSGTLAAFTEESFKGLLQSRWNSTNRKGTLRAFVGSSFKSKVDTWSFFAPDVGSHTMVRRMNSDVSDRKVTQVVDFLNTSFGNVEMYLHAYLFYDGADAASAQTPLGALVLDMDYVNLAFNQRPTKNALPDLGGGPRAQIEAIAGLRVTNPRAHCKIVPSS